MDSGKESEFFYFNQLKHIGSPNILSEVTFKTHSIKKERIGIYHHKICQKIQSLA